MGRFSTAGLRGPAPLVRPRTTASIAAAMSMISVGAVLLPAPTAHASPSARVVRHVDVDGRGRADIVRVTKVRRGVTRVTVRTGRGKVAHKRLTTAWLPKAHWHGAARIDGRRGKELVLLTDSGAHSLSYTVLTWRRGRLVVEHAPGGGRSWFTDGAVWVSVGWKRKTAHGPVRVVNRSVTRDLPHGKWHGRATSYRWGHGRWHQKHSWRLHPKTKTAYAMGGWQVKGLRTWPTW